MTEQLENALKEITSHLQYYGTLSDEEEALGNLCAAIDTAIRQAIAAEREACALIAEEVIKDSDAAWKNRLDGETARIYHRGKAAASIIISRKIRARAEGGEGGGG